jgi:hypothetical protein
VFQPQIRTAPAKFGKFNRPRQPLVNHARRWYAHYGLLTSVVKPIATEVWQFGGNRAETARGSFRVSGRRMEAGRLTAGASCVGEAHRASAMGTSLRLDPFSLPVRFTAADEAADEHVRVVDLHRERVVLRRSVNGMRMALNLPVAAFRGVAIRLHFARTGKIPTSIAVVLEHRDPALSLPLLCVTENEDIVAEWQSWGRVLGLPLLVADPDGSLREPFGRLGAFLRVEAPKWRRRRRSAVARRRPSRLMRRRLGLSANMPTVHRDEREIIARN